MCIRDSVITEDQQEYVPEQIRESYAPPPMPKLTVPKYTSSSVSSRDVGEKFSANCVLMGNISEKKDSQGNVVFNGEIKNIGGRRADFVKMDFVFRKNWSGETRTLTTFIQGSYNTFDSGIVSDASLLPGALGKFELYVPQDFGSFIGYSYVIDWEEYKNLMKAFFAADVIDIELLMDNAMLATNSEKEFPLDKFSLPKISIIIFILEGAQIPFEIP